MASTAHERTDVDSTPREPVEEVSMSASSRGRSSSRIVPTSGSPMNALQRPASLARSATQTSRGFARSATQTSLGMARASKGFAHKTAANLMTLVDEGAQNVFAGVRLSTKEIQDALQQELKDAQKVKKKTMDIKWALSYSMSSPLEVLFRVKGTFWPLIIRRYEIYVFPAIHIALVIYAHYWRSDLGDSRSPGEVLWGEDSNMIPWSVVTLLSPLMVFFLVFFLSQCYTRFFTYHDLCVDIESALQETTIVTLVQISDPEIRWDVVRYMTAAAMIHYFRVTKIAYGKEQMVSLVEIQRLVSDEKEWLGMANEPWEKMMGWPRTQAENRVYTERLHTEIGLQREPPPRLASCPPLLTREEIDLMRLYPGSLMTAALLTWSLQAAKEANIPPPTYNTLQGCAFKLKAAANKTAARLSMPIPLPYFHSLNMLQTLVYALYTYAMLFFESHLTPIVLVFIIVITLGMREVAAALANPFGEDDVDFPVNKWIAQARGIAIAVHPANVPIQRPPRAKTATTSTTSKDATVAYNAADDAGEDASEKSDTGRVDLLGQGDDDE